MTMSQSNSPTLSANQFIKFRRVRAGWYVARARRRSIGAEVVVHITRVSERCPHFGWEVRVNDDEHDLPPRLTSYIEISGGLPTINDAEVEVAKIFERVSS